MTSPLIEQSPTWREALRRGDGLEVARDPDDGAQLWGVFAHIPEGGVEWVADFSTRAWAAAYATSVIDNYPNLGWHGVTVYE